MNFTERGTSNQRRESKMFDFSIIIPTFNRGAALQELLYGIARLDYAAERYEVLVVNDGGAAPARDVVAAYCEKFALRILEQKNQGAGAARNLGAAHARGEWLAFIDDDCVPESNWLDALAQVLKRDVLVGGAVRNGHPDNVYAEASQLLFEFLYEYYHQPRGAVTQLPFFTSNNLALARELFLAHDGFDAQLRFGEDRELCVRLGACGVRLCYAPHARVRHYRQMNLRAFWQQHFQYGSGAYHYHQRRRAQQRGTYALRMEPARFYFEMLRYPRQHAPSKPLRLMCLIAFSQCANACGFVYTKLRA